MGTLAPLVPSNSLAYLGLLSVLCQRTEKVASRSGLDCRVDDRLQANVRSYGVIGSAVSATLHPTMKKGFQTQILRPDSLILKYHFAEDFGYEKEGLQTQAHPARCPSPVWHWPRSDVHAKKVALSCQLEKAVAGATPIRVPLAGWFKWIVGPWTWKWRGGMSASTASATRKSRHEIRAPLVLARASYSVGFLCGMVEVRSSRTHLRSIVRSTPYRHAGSCFHA